MNMRESVKFSFENVSTEINKILGALVEAQSICQTVVAKNSTDTFKEKEFFMDISNAIENLEVSLCILEDELKEGVTE